MATSQDRIHVSAAVLSNDHGGWRTKVYGTSLVEDIMKKAQNAGIEIAELTSTDQSISFTIPSSQEKTMYRLAVDLVQEYVYTNGYYDGDGHIGVSFMVGDKDARQLIPAAQYDVASNMAASKGHAWPRPERLDSAIEIGVRTILESTPDSIVGIVAPIVDLDGVIRHETMSGRTSWAIEPDTTTLITVSRPHGDVVRALVGPDGTALIEQNPTVNLYQRHVHALFEALIGRVGLDKAAELTATLRTKARPDISYSYPYSPESQRASADLVLADIQSGDPDRVKRSGPDVIDIARGFDVLGDDFVRNAIRAAASSASDIAQTAAAQAFNFGADDKDFRMEMIVHLLNSPYYSAQKATTELLDNIDRELALAFLERGAAQGKAWLREVSVGLVFQLSNLYSERTVQLFKNLLNSPHKDQDVQASHQVALAHLLPAAGDRYTWAKPTVLTPLIDPAVATLVKARREVREELAKNIGDILGAPHHAPIRAIPFNAFQSLLGDSEPSVARLAVKTLERYAGYYSQTHQDADVVAPLIAQALVNKKNPEGQKIAQSLINYNNRELVEKFQAQLEQGRATR